MKRGRHKVRCDRMSRYPSHWSLSFLFVILLFQCCKLANFSMSQRLVNTRRPVNIASMSSKISFDDDANFQRDFVVKHAAMRGKVDPAVTHKSNSTLKLSPRVVSLEDQDRATNASSCHSQAELNGDLLAIESNEKSQLISSSLPQRQQLRSAPYAVHEKFTEANHSIFSEPIQPIEPIQHPDESQFLKLHRTAASVPIYLRHPLPSSVTRPQVIAFEHPAAVRKQAASTSHNQDGYPARNQRDGSSATFALLPSWPKIYIAQREQLATTKQNGMDPSELDPKVPTTYPNWSTRNTTTELERVQNSQQQQLESDQLSREQSKKPLSLPTFEPRVNSTASEVEYEETANNRKSSTQKEKSDKVTDWAKLLRQAARADVMESLMLTNKSIVSLLCDADNMVVRFKFRQPFHGLVETNLDPNEQCRLFGNGSQYYEMRIDLYGCGTRQEMPRLFINNIQIQYQNPFLLIHSRLQFDRQQQQQQTVESEQLLDIEELKTIICSYPIRPRAQIPARGHLDHPSNDLNHTKDYENGLLRQGPATNLSERIIEVPGQDVQDSARLFYYEPILLISVLLLLAIACTLALVTSAYLMRRRHQKITSRLNSTIRGSSQLSSSDGLNGSTMRIYNRSPAQMANQRALIAPPLIGLSKQESLAVRPSIKQYPSTLSKVVRGKQRERSSRISVPTKNSDRSARGFSRVQAAHSSTTTDTGDSLDSHTRGEQSSVTTIEIPYVSQSRPEISLSPEAKTSGKRKLERDQAVQADLKAQPEVSTYSEYKQIKRHEKIIETSYHSEPNEADQPKPDRPTSSEADRLSPIPFGSFRSKLTSPEEFKRLQNIKRLFEESRGQHDPTSSLSRLNMRICRTLSEPERQRLIEMLTTDEVFRSNILDSVDRQTFSRRLRDNPNYSERFSDITWKLLEEILLRIEVDELMSDEAKMRSKQDLASRSLRQPSRNYQAPIRSYPSASATTIAPTSGGRRVNRADGRLSGLTRQDNAPEVEGFSDNSIEAVHVSQSNATSATRVPHRTLLDVDSVTSITTPRSTTSYSSTFKQITRYEETRHAAQDSLPYMDEFSQGSISSQSSPSLDDRHRKRRQK